jgi:hypothetical protein
MMPLIGNLSREEKEELVRDLYFNKGKSYHQIAKQARVSPRDIKGILDGGTKGTQKEQAKSKAAQAYDLFSKGKSPMEVAITLDLRESEVTQLYRESWNLKQIYDLNGIYLETKCDPEPFLKLYRLSKAAGLNVEDIIRIMRIANDNLFSLEYKYQNLKSEVYSLELEKQNLVKIIQNYDNQATSLGKTLDSYFIHCEQEGKKLADLQIKRMREENLVRQFQNNVDYLKIREIIDGRVHHALSNGRRILELAALSLIESIRANPEKYSSLIQYNTSPMTDYNIPNFDPYFMFGQQLTPEQQIRSIEDYVTMLSEDADKVLERLAIEVGDDVINDYVVYKSPSPSLSAM